jgi:hypothetical protein
MAGKKGMKSSLITRPSQLGEFRPDWLGGVDRRTALYRALKARLDQLYSDLGGVENLDIRQRMVAERIVFIELQLRDMETRSLDGDPTVDFGRYGFLSNTLTGLLVKLGLNAPRVTHHGTAAAWAEALASDDGVVIANPKIPHKP